MSQVPDYNESVQCARHVLSERRGWDDRWSAFLRDSAGMILALFDAEARSAPDYFESAPIEAIASDNVALFARLEPGRYPESFLHPSVAVACAGKPLGQLMAAWMYNLQRSVHLAYQHELGLLAMLFQPLSVLESTRPCDGAAEALTTCMKSFALASIARHTRKSLDSGFGFFRDIVEKAVPGDSRRLYRYGCRIGDAELEQAGFIDDLPSDRIGLIARTMIDAYLLGFETEGKDISGKSTVSVGIPIGYEAVGRALFDGLERCGLHPLMPSAETAPVNRQAAYDHRFDWALTLDEESCTARTGIYRTVCEETRGEAVKRSGWLGIQTFGEEPFTPVPCPDAVSPSPESMRLFRELNMKMSRISNGIVPRSELSFTGMAFPSPATRGDFAEIFMDTLHMNTLSNDVYAPVQKAIIDALDQSECVRVRGAAGNDTDMTIRLHHLDDPSRQTNFLNCLATVNIPLGEVFTSPLLEGTGGTLHVEEAFLSGLLFRDLRLVFEDGYIKSHSCANFDDPELCRKYIRENLLMPHDTLPLGEFAIGTNTWAYRMARRHGILDLLPVLIIEKMGPHFAIGDTCFSWEEDHPVKNVLDGKEVVARENERTRLRTMNPAEAYTSRHTDITIPYSSLGSISAVRAEGTEIFVIRDGRFVLCGTEMLNEALDEV
ncbi:aminopeptidase [Candidatus Fermentibacteria bacterium]|nr:aminopeptidase [Candidatus Fermentibacteria bacterium]